ncbi:MAG: hypothetical protein JO112_10895, partial [Planctomycetes bacterium]|nr:hypothetical protein [Planctomycetota bacterium]
TLGKEVDLAEHFGFLREWSLLGPFDNSGGKGYDTTYPPEQKVDLGGTYPGKNGAGIRWTACHTTDSYGLVDLNKVVGKHHGEVVYALAVVSSPSERPVQIRAGSDNAVKIFLNGKLLFSRHEYHHGMRMDQHVAEGRLQGGRNEILIKVCQNEQTEDWAQAWAFQLRVCDAVGVKVPLSVLGNKDQARSAGREVRQ